MHRDCVRPLPPPTDQRWCSSRAISFEVVFLAGLFDHRGEQFVVVAADLVMLALTIAGVSLQQQEPHSRNEATTTQSLCQRWHDRTPAQMPMRATGCVCDAGGGIGNLMPGTPRAG